MNLSQKRYIEDLELMEQATELSDEDKGYSNDDRANALVFKNPIAFVFGLIFDQSIASSRAWSAPYHLMSRVGHLDLLKISEMTVADLALTIRSGKSLHRYPKNMAKNLIFASETILRDFGGSAENLWIKTKTISEVRKNFLKLRGIGPKKANLAILMLARDFDVQFDDISKLDLSLDIHLRRVLTRSGLFDTESIQGLTDLNHSFRKNAQCYRAKLGTILWLVGRDFCHPNKPNCQNCPLKDTCQKRLS